MPSPEATQLTIDQFWTGNWCASCERQLVSDTSQVWKQHILDCHPEHHELVISSWENLKRP